MSGHSVAAGAKPIQDKQVDGVEWNSVVEADVRRTIELESTALGQLAERVDGAAAGAVRMLLECRGRVILTGVGKSGLVARKIAATLASTGTPAFFLHPAEAYHGDLGVLTQEDVLIFLSYSGETEEMVRLLPHVRRFGVQTIVMTGRTESTLARFSSLILDVSVEREADSLSLAPTVSTTAMLAMGDAVAVALMHQRGFTPEQFGMFHPGGNLGRKLLLLVKDVMHGSDRLPLAVETSAVREVIVTMNRHRLGAAFIVDAQGMLTGILTDGDLRRLLQKHRDPLAILVSDIMSRGPKTIQPEALAADALRVMEASAITVLPVVSADHVPVGAVHLHDLVKAGLP